MSLITSLRQEATESRLGERFIRPQHGSASAMVAARSYRVAHVAVLTAIVTAVAACGGGDRDRPIEGRIFDERIEVSAASVPPSVWLDLTNVGSRSCRLIVADTLDEADSAYDPTRLPVRDGRVWTRTTDPSGGGVHAAEELYGEVAGQQAAVDPGPPPGIIVEPGARLTLQLALSLGLGDQPRPGAVRVLVCDEPGAYEAGRYAVLEFAR